MAVGCGTKKCKRSREEETKRWDPEDELHQDCGVYAFLKNLSIGMFTMSCDDKLRLLCEFGAKVLIKEIPRIR